MNNQTSALLLICPLAGLTSLVACDRSSPSAAAESGSAAPSASALVAARAGYATKLRVQTRDAAPPETPPAALFSLVKYPAPLGENWAYITPAGSMGRTPAIVWVTGGDCNSIGDCWSPATPDDDQSARQFREAGMVMMYPSLRGACGNPGVKEGFFGEVDDVIAAVEYLAKQPHVDPARIYLGGHSTGATLALLVAECATQLKGVICLGAVEDVGGYPDDMFAFDARNSKEMKLRAPIKWLDGVASPTFLIEGEHGNAQSLMMMVLTSKNPNIHGTIVQKADHFDLIAPTLTLVAKKIMAESRGGAPLALSEAELQAPFR